MVAVSLPKMTVEDYFAFEEAHEEKHEYYHGEIFDMAGASPDHVRISGNVFASLHIQLRGKSCEPMNDDLRLRVSSRHYTYADITVLCGEPEYERVRGLDSLLNPTLIVEVLSPSTEAYDRGKKFQAYQQFASLQEYLLVAQDRAHIDHYKRAEDGLWLLNPVDGLDKSLALPAVGCTLALADVYERVTFDEPDGLFTQEGR